MMQKHIIFIIFTLLFSFSASAQLEVNFSTESTPTPGGTVDVDVSVSNFDDIITLQYFILWDSLVLSYNSILNITDQLEQFSVGSVGTPETAVTLDDGEMSVSWSHSSTNPFTIPDGTRLFTIRLDVVGTDCDSTAVEIGSAGQFQNIEVVNADFEDIGAVSNMLPFALPGTDCGSGGGGGGGQDGIVLRSNSVSGDNGDNICVSIIVDNFTDVQSAQGSMMWDPAVLSYTGNQNNILPGNAFGEADIAQGMLAFNWFDSSGVTPQNLANGTVLFDVCFDVIGAAGTSTTFKFTDSPSMIVFSDSNDEELEFTTSSSTISVNSEGGGGGGNGIVLSSNSVSGDNGDNICIPVLVDNFADVQSAQGSMMWDPAVLSFTGTQNNNLPGNAFGEGSINQGMLAFNWFDNSGVTPVTLANGSSLFEVCFDIIGAAGSSTTFKFTDDPSMLAFSDSNDQEIDFSTTSSTISVAGGGGGGGTDLVITMEDVIGNPGSNVCIPMTADNFTNIQTYQGGLSWDPTVLSYTGTDNSALPGIGFGDTDVDNGNLGFNWFDDTGVTPVSLPNGGTIFEVCFDVIGTSGATSNVDIVDLTNVFVEASDADGNVIDVTTEGGTFTVSGSASFGLSCTAPTFTGGGNACIGVRATGFSNIATVQFQMAWDDSQLTYSNVDDLNQDLSVSEGQFNQTQNDRIRFSWSSTDGEGRNVADGTLLFSVCFDAVQCNGNNLTGNFQFVGDNQVAIEIGNGDGEAIEDVSIDNCSYTISCIDVPCPINFGTASISPPACFGESSGSINVSPTSECGMPVTCTWFQGVPGGAVIETNGSCNLSGVPAGTYILRAEVPGLNVQEMTYEIEAADPIIIDGTIFNVTCGSLGSVNATISGGSGTFNCEWEHNGAVGCNIGDLVSGTYRLLVTDAILGCQQVEDFPVGSDLNLSGTATATEAGCDGGSISITLNQTGDFTYSWSHPDATDAPVQNGLAPGSYNCTITSVNGECSTVVSAVVGNGVEPASVVSLVTTNTSCNGNDGTAQFEIVGGCLPYACEVMAPDGTMIPCENLENLSAGVYGIMFSDASTNPAVVESFTISMADEITVVATTTSQTNISPGTITTAVSGGTPGYFYNWAPESAPGLVQGAMNQNNLEAGEYGLTVTDAAGCTWSISEAIVIADDTDPEAPIVLDTSISTFDVSCGNECDGEWDATVTGSSPFVFVFTNSAGQSFEYSSLPATGLCSGDYTLVITGSLGMSTSLNTSIGGDDPIEVTLSSDECDDGNDTGSLLVSVTGGAGGYGYTWSPIDDTTSNPEGLSAGAYEVVVDDNNGCSVSRIFTVEACIDPPPPGECGSSSTVLTPNADGVNDALTVICADEYPNTFAVYDRWGRLVFDAVNYQGTWDGTDLNGNIVTEGVYYWVMDSTFDNGDHRIFKGYVNVIRETE